MRLPWLALCCALCMVTYAQAESYSSRDQDDGFNPLNVMRDMPSPMSMFDSSDKRHKRHRRPPPPPFRRPPPPAFPAPPAAYAPPIYNRPAMPYQTYQPAAPTAPQPVPQPAVTPPPAPLATTPPPAAYPQDAHTGYSYRPMTTPADAWTAAPSAVPEASSSQSQSTPAPAQEKTVVHKQHEPGETIMIDGKPAVFRPMHLGIDDQSQ